MSLSYFNVNLKLYKAVEMVASGCALHGSYVVPCVDCVCSSSKVFLTLTRP